MTRSTISVLLTKALLTWCFCLEANANRGSSHEDLALDATLLSGQETLQRRGLGVDSLVGITTTRPASRTGARGGSGDLPVEGGSPAPTAQSRTQPITIPSSHKASRSSGPWKVRSPLNPLSPSFIPRDDGDQQDVNTVQQDRDHQLLNTYPQSTLNKAPKFPAAGLSPEPYHPVQSFQDPAALTRAASGEQREYDAKGRSPLWAPGVSPEPEPFGARFGSREERGDHFERKGRASAHFAATVSPAPPVYHLEPPPEAHSSPARGFAPPEAADPIAGGPPQPTAPPEDEASAGAREEAELEDQNPPARVAVGPALQPVASKSPGSALKSPGAALKSPGSALKSPGQRAPYKALPSPKSPKKQSQLAAARRSRGTMTTTTKAKIPTAKRSGWTKQDGYHEPVYVSQRFGTFWLHEMIIMALIVVGIASGIVWQCIFGGRRFRPTKILPESVHWIVPHGMRKIEDMNHLTLIILFFVGVCMAGFVTHELYYAIWSKGLFATDILGVAFLYPCIWHVYRYIGFYDDRLCSKQKEAAQKKREMEELQTLALNEMQHALEQAAESSAGLAERSIEAHKRDFGRFLSWVAVMPEQDALAVSQGLKEIMTLWLSVFQETSLDPIENPRDGRDMKFIDVFESNSDIREAAQDLRLLLQEENVSFLAIEKEILLKTRVSIQQKKSNAAVAAIARLRDRVTLPSWVACGCVGLGCSEIADRDGFAFVMRLCCCKFTIISQGHCQLLLSLVFGIVLEMMYWLKENPNGEGEANQKGNVAMQLGLLVFILCLVLVVWNFERIDNLLKLEAQITELEEARERLEKQRLRILSLFGQTQMLVEFWLNRTIPLLDLMKEFQERFRDSAEVNFQDAAKVLPRSCFVLSEVLRRAGTAEVWIDVLNLYSCDYSESSEDDDKGTDDSPDSQTKAPKEVKALGIWTQQIAAENDRNIRTMTARMESRIPALVSSTAHFFG